MASSVSIKREQFLANLDSTWCILRCSIEHDGISRFVADAGYRSSFPGPPFQRSVIKAWRPILPPFSEAREIGRSPTMLLCEFPVWVYRVDDEATLRRITICSEIRWRGHLVELQSWPMYEEAGKRINGFITNENLPIRKQVANTLTRTGDVPALLLGQMKQEWFDYVASLGPEWSLHDPQGDYRAFGPIPIKECECKKGSLAEEWSRHLAG